MKILIIGFSLSKNRKEGVKNHVYDLAQNLIKQGLNVVIVTNSCVQNVKTVSGFKLIEVQCGTSVYGFILSYKEFINKLLNIIEDEQPDIIHDHFVLPGTSLLVTHPLIKKFKDKNVKFVKTVYNKSLSFRNIQTILIPLNFKYLIYEGGIRIFLNNILIDKVVFKKFDAIIFHASDIGEQWKSLKKVLTSEYIPLGITFTRNTKPKVKVSNNRLVVSYLGHPSFKKGLDIFLDSINPILVGIPNSEIHIAISSTAEGRDRYLRKINTLKDIYNSRVKLRDNVNPFTFYQESSIMVFPLLHDWSAISPPLSILEALTVKSVVVATPVCGISDLIENKQNGFLLKNNTPQEISNMVNDLALKKTLGNIRQAAYLNARKHDWKNVINAYINLYKSLIH